MIANIAHAAEKWRLIKGETAIWSRQTDRGVYEIAFGDKTTNGLLLGTVRRQGCDFWRYSRFTVDGMRVLRISGGVCSRERKNAGGFASLGAAAQHLAVSMSGEILKFQGSGNHGR